MNEFIFFLLLKNVTDACDRYLVTKVKYAQGYTSTLLKG